MASSKVPGHREGKTMVELYADRIAAGRFAKAGFARIVCIDDDVHVSMNKKHAGRTMVPRATPQGGCMNAPNATHRRYGEGVLRRHISMTEDGCWVVDAQIAHFRPDEAAQRQEPRPARVTGQELHLAAQLAQMETLCRDKIANVQGDAGTKKDYELRLPYAVYKDFKDGMKGYTTVYGRNDRIELRHKRTGLSECIDITDIK